MNQIDEVIARVYLNLSPTDDDKVNEAFEGIIKIINVHFVYYKHTATHRYLVNQLSKMFNTEVTSDDAIRLCKAWRDK